MSGPKGVDELIGLDNLGEDYGDLLQHTGFTLADRRQDVERLFEIGMG